MRSAITGTGSYLPPKVVTNQDLEKIVETSSDWIVERTGILKRHIAENELASDLALKAAKNAMEMAGVTGEELDFIIVATITPDDTLPATAIKVQADLQAKNAAAFDINAACSGFLYALTIADSMIRSGQGKTILVIGSEVMSKITDWNDRNTCVLFGDGAGAIVLRAQPDQNKGVMDLKIYSDAAMRELLGCTGGVGRTGTAGTVTMQGKEVYKNAVNNMSAAAFDILQKNSLTADDIDFLVPHQANLRIIESVAKKTGLPPEKVIVTIQEQANTSAASVPLALDHAVRSGKIKPGHLVLVEAMGAGFTWGAGLIRF
ncbi:MAG: ketoacyl-ACP synthase III [Alphaproteobacteria bacterium]|nr:ketoacyl-ACP synthase III [Alphaproteobacteria bacterium]